MTSNLFNLVPSGINPDKRSLKSYIHKTLLVRLFIAGSLVSLVLAFTVFFFEFQRLGQVVNNRAGEIAARFNDEIQGDLGTPPLTKTDELQNKLKMLSSIGKLDLGIGNLIYTGIYDLEGSAIVLEKDPETGYVKEVDAVMGSLGEQVPAGTTQVSKFRYIHGSPHIQLTFLLKNDKGQQAAILSGMFAVSAAAKNQVVDRITRTCLQTIGIVLLTTMILYPIIITLINRLSQQANDLLEANIETLEVLGSAIAKRDSDTDIHNYRVTIYSVRLAEAMGLSQSLIRTLIKGAFLHDVGKIGISDNILLKPGKLTEDEFESMKRHVNYGLEIVARSTWLKDAADVVKYHHEKFIGGGYPYGIKSDSIPVIARIFAIADVFDSITSERPYKKAMPFKEAMEIIAEGRGTHFDPSLVDIFNTIAFSLYENVAGCPDEALRENLESITRQYCSEETWLST
ncbi:MAG: HD domain-containing protein [Desulfobacter sp.]|nr:HD domain-containing protein [Desulfobacter sp.]WDP87091.1 MAG: HD domain-containing protein [Desulfobacter sp.]